MQPIAKMSTPTTEFVHKTMKDELIIRGIKVIDIGYITAVYFVLGMITAMALDKLFGKFDTRKADSESFLRVLIEAICYVWLIGVLAYIARNVAELIPFPLDGMHGFQHSKVKELAVGAIYTTILMFYSSNLQDRLRYLYARAMKPKRI